MTTQYKEIENLPTYVNLEGENINERLIYSTEILNDNLDRLIKALQPKPKEMTPLEQQKAQLGSEERKQIIQEEKRLIKLKLLEEFFNIYVERVILINNSIEESFNRKIPFNTEDFYYLCKIQTKNNFIDFSFLYTDKLNLMGNWNRILSKKFQGGLIQMYILEQFVFNLISEDEFIEIFSEKINDNFIDNLPSEMLSPLKLEAKNEIKKEELKQNFLLLGTNNVTFEKGNPIKNCPYNEIVGTYTRIDKENCVCKLSFDPSNLGYSVVVYQDKKKYHFKTPQEARFFCINGGIQFKQTTEEYQGQFINAIAKIIR